MYLKISLLILGLVTCVVAHAQTTITPDNPNLQYQGRIDFSDPMAPVFPWPANSVKMKFTGTAATLLMTDTHAAGTTQTNYYGIIFDNQILKTLEVNNTSTQYPLASNLDDKEHVIEIFKRAEVGPSTFNGFIITGTILPLDPIATRKIEIVGDGYITGYGNEKNYADPNLTPGYHSVNQDGYSAFGAILTRRFDAQYMCTATAAMGMYSNYYNAARTAPNLYNQLYPYDATLSWDHSKYKPDLMIIFLGGADFFQEFLAQPTTMLDSASFVNTYISFVNNVKTVNPGIKILMLYGGEVNDSYPAGKFELTRWRNYMKAIHTHFTNDGNIYKYEIARPFAPFGEDWLPSKTNHVFYADKLTPIIQDFMQWSVGATTYDCNGVLDGSAVVDGCGVCAGGNTNLTSCLTTGIMNANTKPEITIYPNPTADVVFWDAEQKWELFDAVGKSVLTGEGNEISLKNLSNGVYLIKFLNATSLIRVVKI